MQDDESKKKWAPKDLYLVPEFPEDEGKMTVYDEPESRKRLFVAIMLLIAFILTALFVLLLTGAVKLPPGSAEQAIAAANGVNAPNSIVPPHGVPLISEISANNKSFYAAGNGKYYSWIEIYNPTDHAIDLSGFRLTDNPGKPERFILPSYLLGSGRFIVVFATGKKSKTEGIDASFKLNSTGTLQLADPAGTVIQRIEYPKAPKDNSYAVDMGDFSKWTLTDQPTPGY